jgi:transcriptional regulator with XRE-family HTH domain
VSEPQPSSTATGALVRAARLAHGWTQQDVAARVARARQIYRLAEVDPENLRQQINKIEKGRPIGDQWRRLLAGALDMTPEHLFGLSSDTSLPRPLLIEATATEAKIEQIRAQRDVHAAADHLWGPEYAKKLVDIDLRTIEGLLRNTPDRLRAAVRLEAARIAELGGWLAQDGGDLAGAERLTARAEDYARGARPAIRALILMRRANVTHRRDAHLAIDLAADAAGLLPKRAPGRLGASIARQQAIAALAVRDTDSFFRHINRAADFANAPLTIGDLASYADPAYIASEYAVGLLVLGKADDAADLLRTYLPAWPDAQQRDQAVALARLVRALTSVGDYSAALETLATTRLLYRQAPSARTRHELRLIRRIIISHLRSKPSMLPLTELQRRIYDALRGDPPDA